MGELLYPSCSPKPKKETDEQPKEESFEIKTLLGDVADSIRLTEGLRIVQSTETPSPSGMILNGNSEFLFVAQSPIDASNSTVSKLITSPIVYELNAENGSGNIREHNGPMSKGISGIGTNHRAICQTEWGTVIVAPVYQVKEKLSDSGKGYLMEWDPQSQSAKSLKYLGKANFTSVGTFVDNDGTRAIYYSDLSSTNSFLYKFVLGVNQPIDSGKLYVASFKHGYWILMDVRTNTVINSKYKKQEDVQENLHAASEMAGATTFLPITHLGVDPTTRQLVISVLPNESRMVLFGGLYSLGEEGGKSDAVIFHRETMILGSPDSKFSHPYCFSFDKKGNIWIVNSLSEAEFRSPNYSYSKNGLVLTPRRGPQTGLSFLVATAGRERKFTGMALSETGPMLFLGLTDAKNSGKILQLQGELLEKVGN
jgi:hypothetical protein